MEDFSQSDSLGKQSPIQNKRAKNGVNPLDFSKNASMEAQAQAQNQAHFQSQAQYKPQSGGAQTA